jgi:hypothetical protein
MISFGIAYIMEPQDIKDVHNVLRRHEESLVNNENSLGSLFTTVYSMEMKQYEQYERIM